MTGRLAYEAYCGSWYPGRAMPDWDKLTARAQRAWEAAAEAVLAEHTRISRRRHELAMGLDNTPHFGHNVFE